MYLLKHRTYKDIIIVDSLAEKIFDEDSFAPIVDEGVYFNKVILLIKTPKNNIHDTLSSLLKSEYKTHYVNEDKDKVYCFATYEHEVDIIEVANVNTALALFGEVNNER